MKAFRMPPPPSSRPKQEHSAHVKNKQGEEMLDREEMLDGIEQFVTKSEAYYGIAIRLNEINEALADMRSGGVGVDNATAKNLMAEAQKLIGYLDRMDAPKTEQQAREAFRENATVMVENPFYPEAVEELGDEDIAYIDTKKQVPPESPSQLRARYNELKRRNHELTLEADKLEYKQRQILATIKGLQIGPGIMRDDLNKKLKKRPALNALMNDFSDIASEMANTPYVEAVYRKVIKDKKYPESLNDISEVLEKIGNEKTKLIGEMSDVADRINKHGKAKEMAEKNRKARAREEREQEAEVKAFEDSFMKSDAEKLEEAMLGKDFPKEEEAPPAKSGPRHRKPSTKKAA